MQGFDKKKINFIIILIFGYFSIYNISKFNNYESLKSVYDEDLIELTEGLSYEKDSLDSDVEEKFKLTKKKGEETAEVDNKLEIAKLTNQDISSDYLDDEKNLNLSLIGRAPEVVELLLDLALNLILTVLPIKSCE